MNNPQTSVLISDAHIQDRVRELGRMVTKDFPDGELIVVGILKGAFMFVADLTRAIERPLKLDFMGISSYGRGKTSSGEVKVTKDLDMQIEGANVLIVEDIVDTGVTLSYLVGGVGVHGGDNGQGVGGGEVREASERGEKGFGPRDVERTGGV